MKIFKWVTILVLMSSLAQAEELRHRLFISGLDNALEAEDDSSDSDKITMMMLVKKGIVKSLVPVVESVNRLISEGRMNVPNLALAVLNEVEKSVYQTFANNKDRLPEKEERLTILYVPWKVSTMKFGSSALQYTGSFISGDNFAKPDGFNKRVGQNIVSYLSDHYSEDTSARPAYLAGILLNVVIQKSRCYVKGQLLIGLNPRQIDFQQENDEVRFDHMVIPKASAKQFIPVTLITFNQDLLESKPMQLDVEFGTFGEVLRDLSDMRLAKKMTGYVFCGPSDKASIYLTGTLKEKAVAGFWSQFAYGKAVDFHLYSSSFIVTNEISVKKVNLSMAPGVNLTNGRLTGGCFRDGGIEDRVKGEVNKHLESFINSQTQIEITLNDLLIAILTRMNK